MGSGQQRKKTKGEAGDAASQSGEARRKARKEQHSARRRSRRSGRPGGGSRPGGRRRGLLLALGAVAVLVVAVLALRSSPRRPDVVLITTDTLRPDHLGLYGYRRGTSSNIDRWFGQASVFENARTADANTPPSVTSLLTGLYPPEHGVRLFYQLLDSGVRTLPEMLPEEYQTAGFVSNLVLTNEAIGLASRFDHFDDYVDERELNRDIWERTAERTTDAVLAWLVSGCEEDRPMFLWVHYIDPHGPYAPPPDWERTFAHVGSREVETERMPSYQVIDGKTDGLAYLDAYDEEIAYHDREVGRLLDAVAELREMDEALVIFTADHAEAMMEHETYFGHGYNIWDGITRIPLAIRGPGFGAARRTEIVSGIDVVPTVLSFLGLEVPHGLLGYDLGSEEPIPADRLVYSEALGRRDFFRCAVQGAAKWVTSFSRGKREVAERSYYDLASDPGETQPQPWPGGRTADLLLRRAEDDPASGGVPAQFSRGRRLREPKVAPRADAEAIERLRALGYVE